MGGERAGCSQGPRPLGPQHPHLRPGGEPGPRMRFRGPRPPAPHCPRAGTPPRPAPTPTGACGDTASLRAPTSTPPSARSQNLLGLASASPQPFSHDACRHRAHHQHFTRSVLKRLLVSSEALPPPPPPLVHWLTPIGAGYLLNGWLTVVVFQKMIFSLGLKGREWRRSPPTFVVHYCHLVRQGPWMIPLPPLECTHRHPPPRLPSPPTLPCIYPKRFNGLR